MSSIPIYISEIKLPGVRNNLVVLHCLITILLQSAALTNLDSFRAILILKRLVASGVASLLKAAQPQSSATVIRSTLVTTASHLNNTQNPIRGYGYHCQYASPLAIGAGQMDPNKALDPSLIYDATPRDYLKKKLESHPADD
ncbi:hypothetical protein JHK82_024447 [Glycine max]|nr:hypothetical protein JHK85_025039 [Glycine max]KAG5133259.1 hypothetical protein JHK82_024447 [Glycine max]